MLLYAAVSRKIITPPEGIYLMGYATRIQGNIGVHDDLYVTTLVLDDKVRKVALLTVDHTFINARIVERIKENIFTKSGIQPDNIFVCCSHTHSGPIGYADARSRTEDRAYIRLSCKLLC